jgi:hypothetical protein
VGRLSQIKPSKLFLLFLSKSLKAKQIKIRFHLRYETGWKMEMRKKGKFSRMKNIDIVEIFVRIFFGLIFYEVDTSILNFEKFFQRKK